jgi:hypothetical protein
MLFLKRASDVFEQHYGKILEKNKQSGRGRSKKEGGKSSQLQKRFFCAPESAVGVYWR